MIIDKHTSSTIDYQSLAHELANWSLAGVNISGNIADPDPILRKRGDSAKIFEDIKSDDQVTMAILNRKNRVLLNKNYNWYAGTPLGGVPDTKAEELKDALCKDLENINMNKLVSSILDAPYYGYSVIEIIWAGSGTRWQIKDLIARPNYWFSFDHDGCLCFVGENGQSGEVVPNGKFLLVEHHATYDNPYGIRLLSRCLWAVLFKKSGVKFFVNFMEKYGSPFLLGVAASGATDDEKVDAAKALDQLRQTASGVVPYGSNVTALSGDTAHGDLHISFINFWNSSISKVLMGQTLTAELSGDTGSFAASNTHKEVSDDIAMADLMMVVQAMDELGWIYAQVNAPDMASPTFEYDMPEDLSIKAELDTKLYNFGVDFNEDYIEQTYGIDKSLFSMSPRNSMEDIPQLSFASGGNDSLDRATSKLSKANSAKLQKIYEALEDANDLDDVEEILSEYDLTNNEMNEIMQAVIINAVSSGVTGA